MIKSETERNRKKSRSSINGREPQCDKAINVKRNSYKEDNKQMIFLKGKHFSFRVT